MVLFVDLSSQYQAIKDDVQVRINYVLESGQYVMGPDLASQIKIILSKLSVMWLTAFDVRPKATVRE